MSTPRTPTPEPSLRAHFGSELCRLRTAQGWTQAQLAERLDRPPAVISSVEGAHHDPPEGMGERADALFGTRGMFAHLELLVHRSANRFDRFAEREAAATSIKIWAIDAVPDLFQTEEYARTVLRATRRKDTTDEQIEHSLTERMDRQSILLSTDPPEIWAVLHAAAVYQPVGSMEITRAQHRKLLNLAEHPNITIQMLPINTGELVGSDGPFTLLESAGEPPATFTEGRSSARLIDDADEVAEASRAYDRLRAAALPPEASTSLIHGAMSVIWLDQT